MNIFTLNKFVSQTNIEKVKRVIIYALMMPYDVGGDCFFRSVSHQLHGTPELHFEIRMAREETEKLLQAWGPNYS